MKTSWYCEKCKSRGMASYKKDAGVYEVLTLLLDAHAKKSPECRTDRNDIRVNAKLHKG